MDETLQQDIAGSGRTLSASSILGGTILMDGDLVEISEVGQTGDDGRTFVSGVSLTRFGPAPDGEGERPFPAEGWIDMTRVMLIP